MSPIPSDLLRKCIRDGKTSLNNVNKNPRKSEYPCSVCNYEVKHNDKSIQCTHCELWVHIKCNGISVEEYKERQQRNKDNPELIDGEPWCCITCTIKSREDFVPLIKMSSYELLNMNNLDSMELLNLLPEEEITNIALNAKPTNDQ